MGPLFIKVHWSVAADDGQVEAMTQWLNHPMTRWLNDPIAHWLDVSMSQFPKSGFGFCLTIESWKRNLASFALEVCARAGMFLSTRERL